MLQDDHTLRISPVMHDELEHEAISALDARWQRLEEVSSYVLQSPCQILRYRRYCCHHSWQVNNSGLLQTCMQTTPELDQDPIFRLPDCCLYNGPDATCTTYTNMMRALPPMKRLAIFRVVRSPSVWS